MTALDRNSKADTALFLNPQGAGIASLIVDIGQARTNLTSMTTYAQESSSARTALAAPREIAVVVDVSNGDAGTLVEHSNAGGYTYRMRVVADGVFQVHEAGSLIASVQIDTMEKALYKCLCHWSQREVGGGQVLSELAVYSFSHDKWYFASSTHAPTTPSPTDRLTIGASYGGSSTFGGGMVAFYSVRIGRRFHSTTEAKEDWVAETTPPTLTARQRTPLMTAAAADLPIGGEGNLAGPVYLMAGAATRQADSRLVTPLLNCVPRNPYVEDFSYAPAWFFRDAPDSDKYHMSVRYLWHAHTSPKTNKARVRVFARVFEADGLPDIATVYLRCYSMADLKPTKYYKTATTSIASPNGSLGQWYDLGLLHLARDASGLTYLALAFSFGLDAGEVEEGVTRLLIRAVTIEPCYVEYQGNGYDADVGLGV